MQRKGGRAPSGHLSRLKPVELDPLDEYGLPSKGEKRLLSHKTQEIYYAKIAERYLAFCTEAGDRDGLQKRFDRLAIADKNDAVASSPSPQSSSLGTTPGTYPLLLPPPSSSSSPLAPLFPNQLSQILSALRKLREAIVASKRRDDFATQVYLFAVRLGILASSYETYQPAILYLLRVLHPARNLTSLELREVVSYLILDTACRRGDLAEAYTMRNEYQQVLLRAGETKVDGVLRALVRDDWVLWRRMRRSVDGYQFKIIEFSEGAMRAHVLKAFGRSYLSVEVGYLERATCTEWEELRDRFGVGWELRDNRVVIRKVQGKK